MFYKLALFLRIGEAKIGFKFRDIKLFYKLNFGKG